MSKEKATQIRCPFCGQTREVQLCTAIQAQAHPEKVEALKANRLNWVECEGCRKHFRVDPPLIYSDPQKNILIHWIPETRTTSKETIQESFEQSLHQLSKNLPAEEAPTVRLVFTRVELIELILMLEAGLEQRVIEHIKYTIHSRNPRAADPRTYRLLLNAQDSTDEDLLFALQHIQTQSLEKIIRYSRGEYQELYALYQEDPTEFTDMFPGPYISARELLLEELQEPE